jgi:glycosyltransferase involved in cell wall biosynthesis
MEVSGGAALHVTSAQEIAGAMRSLASSPELRAKLSVAGLKRSMAFSWSRTAIETHAIYTEALQ